MQRPDPIRPAQTRPLRSSGLDNFTLYTPPAIHHRRWPSLLELSIWTAGAFFALLFGIRPLFGLIVYASGWLEHLR
jgi:hypothetical protein